MAFFRVRCLIIGGEIVICSMYAQQNSPGSAGNPLTQGMDACEITLGFKGKQPPLSR
jgi:hypothetical protein